MTILLDTHAFLWFVAGDERLPVAARKAVETPQNRVLLSIASLWEMAIKISLGRLMLVQPFDLFIRTQLEINNIDPFRHQGGTPVGAIAASFPPSRPL